MSLIEQYFHLSQCKCIPMCYVTLKPLLYNIMCEIRLTAVREDNRRLKEKIQGMAAKPPGMKSHSHTHTIHV